MQTESVAKLVAEICQLAEGPSRPVMEQGVKEWLESYCEAAKPSVDLGWDLPSVPWPLNQENLDFPNACAALAVAHDEDCDWCVPLFPEPRSGTVRHLAWGHFHDEVRENPMPRNTRKALDWFRAELQTRGVMLPTGEDETALESFASTIPAIDEGSDDWISNKLCAERLGVKIKTLANHRALGKKQEYQNESCGLHDGWCFWRKVGKAHPLYYVPLMKKHAGHLDAIFPKATLAEPE